MRSAAVCSSPNPTGQNTTPAVPPEFTGGRKQKVNGKGAVSYTHLVTDISGSHKLEKLQKPCLDCPNEGDLGLYVIKSLMTSIEIIDGPNCKKAIKMTKAK